MAENTKSDIQALWERWEQERETTVAAGTMRRYRGVWHRFTAWFETVESRLLTLADWHPITLQTYRQHLSLIHI